MNDSNDVLTPAIDQEKIDTITKIAADQQESAKLFDQQSTGAKKTGYVWAAIAFSLSFWPAGGSCTGWITYHDGRKLRYYGEATRRQGLPVSMHAALPAVLVLPYEKLCDAQGNYLEVFSFVRSMCLLAAVAAKVQPVDAVYVDIKNTQGLAKECKTAADMGFTAKLTIHPDQIDIVNEAFTPSAAEIEAATALVAAFEEHQAAGAMAFKFDGEMVDVPHLKRAQQVLALAQRIDSGSN